MKTYKLTINLGQKDAKRVGRAVETAMDGMDVELTDEQAGEFLKKGWVADPAAAAPKQPEPGVAPGVDEPNPQPDRLRAVPPRADLVTAPPAAAPDPRKSAPGKADLSAPPKGKDNA